jgi:hypothetical protein
MNQPPRIHGAVLFLNWTPTSPDVGNRDIHHFFSNREVGILKTYSELVNSETEHTYQQLKGQFP